MKIVAIVQARMGSSRLPGKVLLPIGEQSLIALLLERVSLAQGITQIVLATTERNIDDPLAKHVQQLGYQVVRGSENDVLARYIKALDETGADVALRITGDCPLIMPELLSAALEEFLSSGVDYLSNVNPPSYPDGFDLEVFSAAALRKAAAETTEPFDREHVTPYLRRSDHFKRANIEGARDLSHLRLTVDEPADLEVVRKVAEHFAPDRHFTMNALMTVLDAQPELLDANTHITRNEGAIMGSGQKLWKRAKHVIPGGNMLLSKRAEMFLPDQWPAYFDRTEGCTLWDLDGNELLDMGIMGIGTNTLGYSHPEVDAAVMETVKKGNMSTLNCPEEVWLAERLVEINPWADMVRFARAGGEANAIAIRIARSAAGRENVAICGYHGWHDWYLSANLGNDENLAGHLLPGLSPNGVPSSLRGSAHPFLYNDYEALLNLVDTKNIGVIKMEVYRNVEPHDNFLQRVRDLATQRGIVLVFDECTSGFRETFGGLHLKYGVEPDLAVYGKTISNGYALTAVVGRREVMEAAQDTFISSTFWTERIGPTAALKTLDVMEREKSWEQITATGHAYRARLSDLAGSHGVEVDISGMPSLTTYSLPSEDAAAYKTFITQELLEVGILASTGIYTCLAHTPETLDRLFEALDPIFKTVAECKAGKHDVHALLKGPICHTGFARLN